MEPYDPPTTVLVQRSEPQGVSTVLSSTDFFQSKRNRKVILEQVDSFQLRDKYLFATTRRVRGAGPPDAEQAALPAVPAARPRPFAYEICAAVRSLSHLCITRRESIFGGVVGVAEAAGKQTAEQTVNTVCFLVLQAVYCVHGGGWLRQSGVIKSQRLVRLRARGILISNYRRGSARCGARPQSRTLAKQERAEVGATPP